MNHLFKKNTLGLTIWVAFLAIFGLATLKSGSAVLFFDEAAKNAAGNYVPFVVWGNFIAGFFYVLGAVAIYTKSRWAFHISLMIAIYTVCLFLAFGFHIFSGGAYEMRTMGAMVLRSLVWIATTIILLKLKDSLTNSK